MSKPVGYRCSSLNLVLGSLSTILIGAFVVLYSGKSNFHKAKDGQVVRETVVPTTTDWVNNGNEYLNLVQERHRQTWSWFLTQTAPPIRAHVLDLEAEGIQRTKCGKWYRENAADASVHRPYASKFMAEILFPLALARSRYATSSIEGTDIIYMVTMCIMAQGKQGSTLKTLPARITQVNPEISSLWPHRAKDFFIVVTSDHGPCANFRESLGDTSRAVVQKPWVGGGLQDVSMLMNEGSTRHGCYLPSKHFTIPTTSAIGLWQDTCAEQIGPFFLFMVGKASSKIRLKAFKHYESDESSFVSQNESMTHEDYLCTMAASTFCLVLRGAAAWSPRYMDRQCTFISKASSRLDEAIQTGCIPVIAVDSYDLPFSRVLDYPSFSIHIKEKEVATQIDVISKTLRSYSDEEILKLKSNVKKVQPFFRYTDPEKVPGENANSLLLDMVMFQIWNSRQNV